MIVVDFLFKKVNNILLHENKFYSFIHFFDDVDDFFYWGEKPHTIHACFTKEEIRKIYF